MRVKKVLAWINSKYPDAQAVKSSATQNAIEVTFDYDVNSGLPEKFVTSASDIYENCHFDDGSYRAVMFTIKAEKDIDENDNFNMIFKKNIYGGTNKMSGQLWVYGSTFYKYNSEVADLIKNDPCLSIQNWEIGVYY